MITCYYRVRFLFWIIATALLAFPGVLPRAQFLTYQVVASYPHDPRVYTQGLIFHEGNLFLGTGLHAGSFLRHIELPSGKIIGEASLSEKYFGEGIAMVDGRIIQLTWLSRTGFVYDAKTFKELRTFSYDTEGWGLTYDGKRLILSDGTDRLYFLDPNTFENQGHINVQHEGVPLEHLNELEFVEGKVWANQWYTEHVLVIDPQTGAVNALIDFTGLYPDLRKRISYGLLDTGAVLNGIAYDNKDKRIFITGKLWPSIYEVIVHPLTEPIAPRIDDFVVTPGSVKFTTLTSRGISYQVESSLTLSSRKWEPVGPLVHGTGHKKTFEVQDAISSEGGFFRVTLSIQ
ncbi:MAG TPA: glutaminyl-peptide cyclotransferase [Deltaproteobacteria bacterium]|nr:glutaminyl-peptide cyclotransferase [Deltaproteobacteria bacterium]